MPLFHDIPCTGRPPGHQSFVCEEGMLFEPEVGINDACAVREVIYITSFQDIPRQAGHGSKS